MQHADAICAGRQPTEMAKAYEVARALLGAQPDVTGGADHYYAPLAMLPRGRVPEWAIGVTPTATVGGHVFVRLRPSEGAVHA